MSADPFQEVVDDTREQMKRLAQYLSQHESSSSISPQDEEVAEVQEIVDDIAETLVDLNRSVDVIEKNNANGVDIENRRETIAQLKDQYEKLKLRFKVQLDTHNSQAEANITVDLEEPDDQNNMTGGQANPFQEQMLREQDTQLDDIHQTMKNLHLQAETMGQELEDQGQLLDDMDQGMDTVAGKLARGRRQLEWVYEKNKERYNDCCIMLLIIALIVLLVLAFIA
ncbi:uncharacterized protein GVI51_K06347 [Nakaseomyces glabratus]|uniref:t-SNARE affecting a late Golgi compartment protein 1 n=1 Tax=Candida glabrata (strain ATCC 2001 / BCRC 20586 / JCM 3761 / NBRC 0622 / NRRL Y-65 / CBS 138) TaxID=284593 RepID=Q6FMN8_CANGA|nr:uncharacterized protein CAGL0K06501g [Nakaseomyces glabratus]KAH7597068.1 t-SNARE coiled-coil homology domain profile [Nakaseomyces glabratus]KAH7602840.1 t-SNARE coiled-coil homology domain profile [Nakaseomyces glabratus]KAJ9572653.1 hypothetical protein LTX96_0000853 [Nakaseomyces glabratus]OXB41583.1 hypothetical protein B1J91_K06501g [Nakaseomyces glabratus]OXB46883.1 hypothetical protein B1J92_K06501g [Nakaseomyces glabratus]|eukprot:XP_448506.1 uncharacterized protein CAGL0K06501g [[Candida] glabrata]